MNTSLKLTIAWALLLIATFLSLIVSKLEHNEMFVSILALKKFLLVGFIYLEGIEAHWLYRIILIIGGISLIIITGIFKVPLKC